MFPFPVHTRQYHTFLICTFLFPVHYHQYYTSVHTLVLLLHQYKTQSMYYTKSVQFSVLYKINTILSTVQYQYNTLYCTISKQYSVRYNISTIHCTSQYQYNTQYGSISVQHTVLLNISTVLSTVQYQYNTLYCTISINTQYGRILHKVSQTYFRDSWNFRFQHQRLYINFDKIWISRKMIDEALILTMERQIIAGKSIFIKKGETICI